MSLMNKLMKNSKLQHTQILADSELFEQKEMIPTAVPSLNVALSGSLRGGLGPGLTMFAGPSKHFKSLFTLICAKAYLDKYEDAILLFYDSEFGTPSAYFEAVGIDPERVLHSPITDVETLKFDITNQLNNLDRNDKVFIAIDSVGNLASKKEVEDAVNEKSVADMSRAKSLKSLFRIITPHLSLKNIPMVVVNHTYKEIGMFPKDVVGGGTGSYYSADNIYIIGRQQEKEGTEITGYHFIINVEKSRHTREKSKIPVTVKHEGGISKYSGLLEMALSTGHVIVASKGWYSRVDMSTGEIEDKKWRAKDTFNTDFWDMILGQESFHQAIEKKYRTSTGNLIDNG